MTALDTAINSGDTAWLLVSAALVLLMTPALAFFYGGMVRAFGVLNTMMLSIIAMGTVGVMWVLYGYSMAFGPSTWGGLIGKLDYVGLRSLLPGGANQYFLIGGSTDHAIPSLAFVGFQAAFAMITVALVSGAVVERIKFSSWTLFTILWGTIVYFPVANWVFGTGWILNKLHAEDFAGGTAIHINAGTAGLALALVLGPRIGWGTKPMRPHNLTYVMLGAAVLWFGWFGFNAGSGLSAGQSSSLAWVNTMVATCAAMLGWLITERIRDGHPTSLGASSGIVAGLVAITPAAGFVSPIGAIVIGLVAGIVCALAIGLKYKFHYDDALDVVGVHLVGGLVGTLLIGLFGVKDFANAGSTAGLFYGGGLAQLGRQALAAVSVMVFSFVATYIIARVIKAIMGLRLAPEAELSGADINEHAEIGYDLSNVRYSSFQRINSSVIVPKEEVSK